MIANFINLAFGQVSLRGVARVRHAALVAHTGSKHYAGSENAWDSTGNRAQGGFTSPAWELGWRDPGLAADVGC